MLGLKDKYSTIFVDFNIVIAHVVYVMLVMNVQLAKILLILLILF